MCLKTCTHVLVQAEHLGDKCLNHADARHECAAVVSSAVSRCSYEWFGRRRQQWSMQIQRASQCRGRAAVARARAFEPNKPTLFDVKLSPFGVLHDKADRHLVKAYQRCMK